MSKMFVHYSGTVAQFKQLTNIAEYKNKIVFIKGGADGTGAAIYTHGEYYANLNDALAGLKYISSVKAGGVTATAQGPNGVIEFSATDPTTVSVTAGSTGVTIGLTENFKKAVSDNTAGVAANAKAISDEATNRGNAITAAKNELTTEINKKADSSVVTGVDNRVKAIEADYLKTADIAGKVDKSAYDVQVAALVKADTDNLKAAKDYADAEIAKLDSATVAAQVEANKQAIAILNGDVKTENSVRYITAQELAKIINDNDATSVDTLEEIAAWIADHPNSVAAINKEISDVKALVGTTAVATQISTAISNEVTRANGAYADKNTETVASNAADRAEEAYTLAGQKATAAEAKAQAVTAISEIAEASQTSGSTVAVTVKTQAGSVSAVSVDDSAIKKYADDLFLWEELN